MIISTETFTHVDEYENYPATRVTNSAVHRPDEHIEFFHEGEKFALQSVRVREKHFVDKAGAVIPGSGVLYRHEVKAIRLFDDGRYGDELELSVGRGDIAHVLGSATERALPGVC